MSSENKPISHLLELANELAELKQAINEHCIVSRADLNGNITYVNQTFLSISQYSREELIGKNHNIVNSGFHERSFFIVLWKTISSKKSWFGVIKNKAKDGTFYWVATTITPILSANGDLREYLSLRTEITDQLKLIEEEAALKERFQLATKAGGVGIWDMDIATDKIFWDPQMYVLYGLDPKVFLGAYESWRDGVHSEDLERVEDEIKMAIFGEKEFNTEFRVVWPDQSVHYIRAMAIVQRDEKGQAVRMIGTNWDITYKKLAEQELIDAHRQAEIAHRQMVHNSKMSSLGEMAGGVAHEINNPLAIIMGKANRIKRLLADPGADRAVLFKDVDDVLVTTERIAKIVRGLRTFSRNADNDPFVRSPIRLIVSDTLVLCQERFKIHNVKILLETIPDVNVDCRPIQISQVLLNLLNNSFDAIEKLEDKWVRVSVQIVDNRLARFIVSDCGLGIPEEVAEKLMHPFFTTKGVGKGTGLGLSISRGIAQVHGGDLRYIASEPHTTFYFEILLEQTH